MKKTILYLLFSFHLLMFFSCTEKKPESEHVKNSLNTMEQIESNKKLVTNFYKILFGDKDIDAIDKYIGNTYIQHNPNLPDGKEVLKKEAIKWFKGQPKTKINIQHLGGDSNFVYLHTKSIKNSTTFSVIDIFKIENNKIVEHWDVVQKVPQRSKNKHPMF